MKKIGLIALVITFVGALLGAGYFLKSTAYIPSQNSKPAPNPSESALLVGSDKDTHGCIGSAGYTWCEVKQKCLRSWEELCANPTNDEDDIKAAIKQAIITKNHWDPHDIVIGISKREGDYAKGGVNSITPGAGGGLWFGAKIEGVWKLLWDGNGVIFCKDFISVPDFPKSILPECYDDTQQKIITR